MDSEAWCAAVLGLQRVRHDWASEWNCVKARMFHSQTHLGKLLVFWLSPQYNTKWKQWPSVKQILCVDLLPKSTSPRTLRFLVWVCCSPTENNQFTALPSSKASVVPSVYFQCWDTAGKYAGCLNAYLLFSGKNSVHTVWKARTFHSIPPKKAS